MNKIYTKTGDKGETSMLGGKRISKSCLEMDAIGEVDELNTELGVLVAELRDENVIKKLTKIQHKLFVIGSNLAGLQTDLDNLPKLEKEDVEFLENWIDEMNEDLPELTNFILPGGCRASALCYRSRAVCRRAERKVVSLEKKYDSALPLSGGAHDDSRGGGLVYLPIIKKYLNRLSDLLFVLGRWSNKCGGIEESLWEK